MPNKTQVIKRIIFVLCLLGVNVLVSFAALVAFLLFLFRGDPVLAALPALFALPAIVLQPWFLVFFLVPVERFVVALLTTVMTIFVYGWLEADGKLERPRRFLLKFKTRRTFAVIAGVVLLAISVAVARYMDFPALNHGFPPSVEFLQLNATDSRYYCLGKFIDSEWLWQARVSEPELARLEERFALRPIDRGELPQEFRSMAPYWWRPSITERTRVLSTPDFPLHQRGPDGWHALATWNPDDQVLHVWIKDNF